MPYLHVYVQACDANIMTFQLDSQAGKPVQLSSKYW